MLKRGLQPGNKNREEMICALRGWSPEEALASGVLAGAPTATVLASAATSADHAEQRTRPPTTTRDASPTPPETSEETPVREKELDEVGFENFSQEEAEVDVWNILGLK